MATKEGFTIEISSRYEGWWRYNVALMCGCFDTAGNRTGFASTEAHVADVGSNLRENPATALHADWAEGFAAECSAENVQEVLRREIGLVFSKVLEHAGVYKRTKDGRAAFLRFADSVR